MNITVLTFDSLDSTNTEALKQARQGANEGLCIVARQQTAGRGRRGRTWASAKDTGLYFSIVLRPRVEAKYLTLITLMSGIAVYDTLHDLGLKPDIKWVNDILINEKKIAGILAETTETEKGLAVVVGIGINLKTSNIPTEIFAAATSVDQHVGQTPTIGQLTDDLTKHLKVFYEILESDSGSEKVIAEWRKRSSYFSGKGVRITLENEAITGVTGGLEPNGALRVVTEDGLRVVQAGDVQLLRSSES